MQYREPYITHPRPELRGYPVPCQPMPADVQVFRGGDALS